MSPSISSDIISLTLEVDCNLIKVVTENRIRGIRVWRLSDIN